MVTGMVRRELAEDAQHGAVEGDASIDKELVMLVTVELDLNRGGRVQRHAAAAHHV